MYELYSQPLSRTEFFVGAVSLKFLEYITLHYFGIFAQGISGSWAGIFEYVSIIIHLAFFIVVIAMITRRIIMAGYSQWWSFLGVFELLQIVLIVICSLYPGRYEKKIPDIKKELKDFNFMRAILGGYGV